MNPNCVQAPWSHFRSVMLFVQAAQSVAEELACGVNTVRELSVRLHALGQAIH